MNRILPPLDSKIRRSSLVEAVYDTLLEAILSGRLASGSILSEVALAQELDVSRTPVHDALRQLAKDGLVEQTPGRRARVAGFNTDDVFEIFEMRKYLEGPAVELAARRMDTRQLAPLRGMIEELMQAKRDDHWMAKWISYDEQFHETIALASGNKLLYREIIRYRLLHRGFNRLGTTIEGLQLALAEHAEILAALEKSDGPAAHRAMLKHIDSWQKHFVRNFTRAG